MTPRILWFALFGSTLIFLAIPAFLDIEDREPLELGTIVALALAGVGTAVASRVVPSINHRQSLKAKNLQVTDQVVRDASDVLPYRDAPRQRVFADPKAAENAAIIAHMTPFILGMALAEATAQFGFVLMFLGLPMVQALPFFVVAWILMLLRFPTPRAVVAPLEKTYDAKLVPVA